MVDHKDQAAIRARAYRLWVESGYADGYQDAHWRQAEREVAEKAGEGRPEASGGVPTAHKPQGEAGQHVDGMSPHPSVLDPGPGKSGA